MWKMRGSIGWLDDCRVRGGSANGSGSQRESRFESVGHRHCGFHIHIHRYSIGGGVFSMKLLSAGLRYATEDNYLLSANVSVGKVLIFL